ITGNGKFISAVGTDQPGRDIIAFLNSGNFDTSLIQLDPEHQTGKAVVELSGSGEPSFNIVDHCAWDYIYRKADHNKILENCDMLYYGTLAQRSIVTRDTIQNLWQNSLIKFCDLNIRQHYFDKQLILDSLTAADILKINSSEMSLVCRLLYEKDVNGTETGEFAQRLIDDFKLDLLCITLGEDGAAIYKEGKSSFCKAGKREIIDTVGAGDAFSAVLAIGHLLNWNIEKIISAASAFAADICTVSGAVPPDRKFYDDFAAEYF
ncbi:MAG: PfkB family carbohydrate kinase, partial [Syntrophothermus sp.]